MKFKMITAIFALIISLGCFWFGFKFIQLYLNVKNWDTVEATILSKKVAQHEKSSTRSSYAVRIEYQYTVGSTVYQNNKVYLAELIGGQVNHMQSAAEEKVNQLGNTIPIYVNPKQPEQSVIFCEGIALYVFVVMMGVFSFLYGIVSLFQSL